MLGNKQRQREGLNSSVILTPYKNVPASDKPKDKFGRLKRARVVYENDIAAIKKRYIPSIIIDCIWALIVIALLAFAIYTTVTYLMDTGQAEEQFQEVVERYVEPEPIPVEEQDPDTSAWPPIVDFEALQRDNPDVAGWLRIPGTSVDYPVMVNAESDYYLHRNMYGQYSMPGAIFADHQNTRELDENHIVIYGHHMITPTMFHDVYNYKNKDFFDAHRVVYLETPETTYVLRAVEAYEVEPTEYETRQVIFNNTQDFQSYLDTRLSRSDHIVYDDYERKTSDRLVTLVTCNETGKRRQIVECVVEQEYPTSMVPQVIETALNELAAAKQQVENE